MRRLPLAAIETLFLDVGNTLISMDYEWIARELAARGHACDAERVARAEATARPRLGRTLAGRTLQPGDAERAYLGLIVRGCTALDGAALESFARELALALEWPGRAWRLWSRVLPGVPAALADLREAGYRLVVVSNSDGTVEHSLERLGLRDPFHAVLDSHRVGSEKPDPGIFRAALAAAGTAPERVLHVGDLYDADVAGARRAGVHPVLLDPHRDWGEVDCAIAADVPAVAIALLAARAR